MDRTCLCGCGEPLVGRDRIKKGHGKRLRDRMVRCACGCGTMIHKFLPNYYRCEFAHGHGTPRTVEHPEVNCLHCGTLFEAKPWRRREGKDFYCSQKCRREAKKAGYVAFTCSVCGKEVVILRKLYGSRRGKFCSNKCDGLSRIGKTTNFKPGAGHPRWKGGYVKYYGPNWRQQQRQARARDKVCQRCSAPPRPKKALDVHHRTPFRMFGLARYEEANRLGNLICYCPRCHGLVEAEIEPEDREPGRFGR